MTSWWKAVAPHDAYFRPWQVESTARAGLATLVAKHVSFPLIANGTTRCLVTNPSPSPGAATEHDIDLSFLATAALSVQELEIGGAPFRLERFAEKMRQLP
jgi:hypothetical protein